MITVGFPILLSAQDTTKLQIKNRQKMHSQLFVDKDGDGYNDNAPDHDGDGIPNGLDPDWAKQKRKRAHQAQFIDLDGDGINDNLENGKANSGYGKMKNMNKDKGASLNSKNEMSKGKGNGKGKGRNK